MKVERRSPGGPVAKIVNCSRTTGRRPLAGSRTSHLLTASTRWRMPGAGCDEGVPPGSGPRTPLRTSTRITARVAVRTTRSAHVARVYSHVPRRVGDDELAPRGREVAVGDVDRDALLALGGEAVEQQREVEVRRRWCRACSRASRARPSGRRTARASRAGASRSASDLPSSTPAQVSRRSRSRCW